MKIIVSRGLCAAALCILAFAQPAFAAGEIVAPVSAIINSGGPGAGSIADTYNQNGLSSHYTSGTTDFNAYLATNPTHALGFSGNEWFSNFGSSTASVTYDLGSILGVNALALWNEESSGIGALKLFGSTDGTSFASLGSFNPIDNPLADYAAEVFNFASSDLRFVRFDMSGCPQVNPGSYQSCAIGEVAFRASSAVSPVPETSTWAMMLIGFAAAGLGLRRRKKAKLLLA